MSKEFAHLDAKRRREKPTAIGRMPPDFLFMAKRCPPKKIGATSEGQRPDKTRLTKAAKEVRKSWPDSWHIIKSRICCGRRKSGSPAEPAGNVRTARRTSDSSTSEQLSCCGAGKLPAFPEAGGCFSLIIGPTEIPGGPNNNNNNYYYHYYYHYIASCYPYTTTSPNLQFQTDCQPNRQLTYIQNWNYRR